MDVLPRLKLLNALAAFIPYLCLFYSQSPFVYLTDSKELISIKPLQGSNLNHLSISGLEPEGPITQHVGTHIKLLLLMLL
jgi:hypothetical protein